MPILRIKKAFTLIELLIVIAVIGILVAIVIANFGGAQGKGRDSRRKSDLDAVKKALELFKGDTAGGFYPVSIGATNMEPTYIKKLPPDPQGGAYTYSALPAACSGTTPTTANCTSYTLVACLENLNDPQKDSTDTCTAADKVSYTVTNP